MVTKGEYERISAQDPVPIGIRSVRTWGQWNTQPQPPEVLLCRAIRSETTGDGSFSTAYALAVPGNATPELVDDLVFVQSGLFSFEGYSPEALEATVALASKRSSVYVELVDISASTRFPEAFRSSCAAMASAAQRASAESAEATERSLAADSERIRVMEACIARGGAPRDALQKLAKLKESVARRAASLPKRRASQPYVELRDKIPWRFAMDSLPVEYLQKRLPLIEISASDTVMSRLANRGVVLNQAIQSHF